jgi:hypothetical protein
MRKTFLAAIAVASAVALSGCSPGNPILIKSEIRVVTPSPEMYRCPTMARFPNPASLTDVQVAKTLVALYSNNKTCKNSLESIRKFLDNAKREAESN